MQAEKMENLASEEQPPAQKEPSVKKRKPKKRNLQHSADIVFTRGNSVQTMPSLSKLLRGVTGILGLNFVWEYRSPSKSVQPHYQCKLCFLSCLQHDIIDHVKGWKHCYKYMKKNHADKITFEEEAVVKDPSLKASLRATAVEVDTAEERGQIKVILKEPCDVLAFKGFRSAAPKPVPPPVIRPIAPLLGPRFQDSRLPPLGGPFADYPGEYKRPGFGDYASRGHFPESSRNRGPFTDDMGQFPPGGGNGFGPDGGRAGAQAGVTFKDGPMDRGGAIEHSSLPNTLLAYLDTFQIESESDAQLVLKVTQKLTDVLMEYRLRTVSSGSDLNSVSTGDDGQYSTSLSGPSRYSDGPARYYK
ncbi:uncharacterized protein si:ch211-197h24.6 [Nothobranchius furzeri]|uniref:Si:ch211-197h24.6 n=2 Tax=Nothobranchius furzeri TaxID=105023 RepID=A0A8C6LR72_NOTFU|nr:transcript variant X1 [Nothobranchius furzeri]